LKNVKLELSINFEKILFNFYTGENIERLKSIIEELSSIEKLILYLIFKHKNCENVREI